MYDSYNIAHKYLYEKYGGTKTLVSRVSDKLRNANKKQRKNILDNITENDYQHGINNNKVHASDNHDDIVILTLMGQYYLSYAPKVELQNKLISMGLIDLGVDKHLN